MGGVVDLNTILVPFSLFLTVGYHVFLWHSMTRKPSLTAIGMETSMRRVWFQPIKKGGVRMGILATQSLRNSLLETVLIAMTAITINTALAALINNAYSASHSLSGTFFGSQSGLMFHLKYVSASLFLLASFLCSSMGVGCLIDATILINASGEFSSPGYAEMIMERGFMFALVGNRMLCMAFPLLSWMLGPVSLVVSSVALVCGLYELDFGSNCTISKKQSLLFIEEDARKYET
ncbi:hypothetical protein PVL29_009933 [Vitis rotundifolia]|uniref:Uncharacterized protein n=1 Tax=Vitis rotundifolia TaxID=103349 RepID=A0AA39DS67_VITRO|nr:hypothetical protein PVL29_009933 [Vitis rotundifolia]